MIYDRCMWYRGRVVAMFRLRTGNDPDTAAVRLQSRHGAGKVSCQDHGGNVNTGITLFIHSFIK